MECDEVYGAGIPLPADILIEEDYREVEDPELVDWEHDDNEPSQHFFVETQERHELESSEEEGDVGGNGRSISPIPSPTTSDISMAPSLVGKETSHAFFCFTQSDSEWVANVVRKLQSPAYGFKCCNNEHNFDPESCKADFILSCVHCCKKVVVVVSPEFLTSSWCVKDNADVLKKVTGDSTKVVVVTVAECTLPSCLQHFTPLNAMSRNFWQRFIAALRQEAYIGDIVNSLGSGSVHVADALSTISKRSSEGLYNGMELTKLISENHLCSVQFDSFYCPDELLRKGVAIPQKDYASGIHHLMSEPKLQWYTFCYSRPFCAGMCSLLCILLVLGLVGKTSAFGNEGSIHWGWALLLSVVLSTIIVFLLLVIAYYEKIKLNRNLDFRLAKINATIMKHNILLGLTDECVCLCSHAVLHFIYYNTDQCIGQIQNFLMRQQVAPNSIVQDTITLDLEAADDTVQLTPSKKDREKEEQNCAMTVIGTLGPESYQEEAELLILQFSSQYVRKLVTKKLGSPKHHRHMPRGYCLCQYVEKKVFKMEI